MVASQRIPVKRKLTKPRWVLMMMLQKRVKRQVQSQQTRLMRWETRKQREHRRKQWTQTMSKHPKLIVQMWRMIRRRRIKEQKI